MGKWVAIGLALGILVVAQLKLDLLRVANTELQKDIQKVHQVATMNNATTTLSLTSPAFENDGSIPSKYTCDASSTAPNPPLEISGVPNGAKSLALIVDDPDVPKQVKADGVFDHWVLYNIDTPINDILLDPTKRPQLVIPEGAAQGQFATGLNGAGKSAYYPPCPPPQYEPSEHRYVFTLYALDAMLSTEKPFTKDTLLQAMQGHILAQTELIGRYKRQ